jgi:hypothetical protein
MQTSAKLRLCLHNYGNLNVINKNASKLFWGNRTAFVDGAVSGVPTNFYAEKSVRNVYDALSMDFDALENELIATTPI